MSKIFHFVLAGGAALAAAILPMSPASASTVEVTLTQAVAFLPELPEDRTGYTRDKFRHWIDADGDGCHARNEVLIAEAIDAPTEGDKCALTGGRWYSYYDGTYFTNAGDLDVDHMVPLAEAWDSGASSWTSAQRRSYANDLDDDRLLVAVSAKSNRSKADKDPAEWLPPATDTHCRYISEWVAMKTRWRLSADPAEKRVLEQWTSHRPGTTITVTHAI